MAFFDPVGMITDLVHSVELFIDQQKIDQVTSTLEKKAGEVHGNRLKNLSMPASTFGGSPKAAELGVHHQLAHEVVVETLVGVVEDLKAFRAGIQEAERQIGKADDDAAADLHRKHAASILVDTARHDAAGAHNHDARNQFVDDQGEAR